MDSYDIMSLLLRLETNKAAPYAVTMLYSETLAEIAPRLTADEMRRLLLVGAYVCNGRPESKATWWEAVDDPQIPGKSKNPKKPKVPYH
jgi:hypothetical protein